MSRQNFYPRPPGGGRHADQHDLRDVSRISIHALRVEGDPPKSARRMKRWYTFLSTPSGWRATLFFDLVVSKRVCISIHALRVEGDRGADKVVPSVAIFLSTPSGWRATSPRTGGRGCSVYFYPRPPGGGRRRKSWRHRFEVAQFLSTPSGWRATFPPDVTPFGGVISIHALRMEGDDKDTETHTSTHTFLSTPSGWRTTVRAC